MKDFGDIGRPAGAPPAPAPPRRPREDAGVARGARAAGSVAHQNSAPDDALQRVRIQNGMTRRDLVWRFASVSTAFLLGSYFLDAAPLFALYAAFLVAEAAFFALYAPSNRGSRLAWILLLAAAFSCATVVTSLALMLSEVPSPVARTTAVAILVTALLHCVIIRTAWVALGLATAAPLVVGLADVILDLVPIREIPPAELAIGAAALSIAALYVGHGIWEMNATRRRLMEANEAVRAASQERSRFFAAVSHELRTPLNAICGMAELLADDRTPEHSAERANLLLRSARSLNAIVDDILDQARLDSGKHVLNPREADLHAEIHSSIEIFRPHAEGKGLALRVELAEDVPRRALFDPQKTRQVLSNLVCNAIKYTTRGAVEVRVDVDPRGEEWLLTAEVSDTGPGLDAEAQGALFADYERCGADAGGAPGTGLGLAISRRFARMMNGDIEVVSEPGAGSTFRFTAHIGAALGVAPEEPSESPRDAGAAGACAPGPVVLLVDDTPSNRYVARAYLKGFASRVDEAANGREALDLIRRNDYGVVLLDMHMPVLDGPSTLRALEAENSRLPVIVLTANSEEHAALEEFDIHSVLPKPVRKADLISAIGAATASDSATDGVDPTARPQKVGPTVRWQRNRAANRAVS